MPSFQISITPSRRAASRYISQVRRALQRALVDEQAANGLTQSEIARRLNVHRSVINREFRGQKDMTLGRVGELAWAMGRRAVFELPVTEQAIGTNVAPPPQPAEVKNDGGIVQSGNAVATTSTTSYAKYAEFVS